MPSVFIHFLLWRIGVVNAETQTTDSERDSLARHAAGLLRLAEIGVWHGVTTSRLRTAMSPEGTLFAVDPYPVGRLGFSAQKVIAHREVSKVTNGEVVWMRDTSIQAAQRLAAAHFQLDFVFIDGDHSYEGLRLDWEKWTQLVCRNGKIALHDSRSHCGRQIDDAGSVRYTNAVVLADPRFEVIETIDSLTVLQRRSTPTVAFTQTTCLK